MKARRLARVLGVAAVVVAALAAAGCSSGQAATATSGSTATTTVTSGSTQAPTQSTSPSATASSATGSTQASAAGSGRVLPVTKNPIANDSTKQGLQIIAAMAENNVDPATNKDLSDRLQITIKNTSGDALNDLEIYYQMKDTTTQATEGYYQKLTGFSLASGAEGTVYFDNETGVGHYPENKFSLYRTSANEVVFTIEVSAAGYAPAMGEAVKAVGTGENPGE